MKKSFVLFFGIALAFFTASCSGDSAAAADTTEDTTAAESTSAPAQAKTKNLEGASLEEMMYNRLKKGMDNRKIALSPDQEAALKQLIGEAGLTRDNVREKRKEILDEFKANILTEEQKAKVGK
jgi:hypothetical protein